MKQRRSYLVTLVLPELRLAFLLFVFLLILPHTPALRKGLIAPPGIKRRPGVPAWLDVFPLVTSLRGRLGQGKSTSVQTPRKNFALEDSAVEALKIAPVGVLAHRVLSLSCAAVAARWIKMMMPSGEQSAEERDRQRFRGTPSVVTWCQPKVFLQVWQIFRRIMRVCMNFVLFSCIFLMNFQGSS